MAYSDTDVLNDDREHGEEQASHDCIEVILQMTQILGVNTFDRVRINSLKK